MSVALPEERVVLRDALPSLAILSACIVAYGLCRMIEGFVRALFGTAAGAVGWIPFAGRVVSAPIHRIEQKVTHALGYAERGLDARIGASFHKLAIIARRLPGEVAQQAALLFVVAAALPYFMSKKLFHVLLHKALAPLWAFARRHSTILHHHSHALKAQAATIHGNVLPRTKAAEATGAAAIGATLPRTRVHEREQDLSLGRLWKWVRHRKAALTTGAFLGAFVWALGKHGLGWLRCSNVKKVGRALCRAPSPLIDALIAALLAEVAFANFDQLVRFAQDTQEEVTHEVSRLLGLELPRGRFTIE